MPFEDEIMASIMASGLSTKDSVESWKQPHAFHLNLPPHHLDEDGTPFITKYAHKKSRYILGLVKTLELNELMFLNPDAQENDESDDDDDDDAMDTTDAGGTQADGDDDSGPIMPKTLSEFAQKCSRLHAQLSALENLKHSGLSRWDLSLMVLRLLRLLTATITYEYYDEAKSEEQQQETRLPISKVTIHYDLVGYIHTASTTMEEEMKQAQSNVSEDSSHLEGILKRPFALPSPARETLLSILVSILSNKGPLRSVSNAAIYPATKQTHNNDSGEGQDQEQRFLLILHWRPLLRMLLRTTPYLNERKSGTVPLSSNARQSTILKRTVHMIRDARHFFDQGIRPPGSAATTVALDNSAVQLWEMVRADIMFHSHTNASYRSLVMFYLFQPSRCSSTYYQDVLPDWLESWSNIDRCPEIDFLWLALFCRARKYLPHTYDWGPIRRRLLTHAQYWLLLPIGGAALDKSFPRASAPRSRSCPSRLKAFTGSSSSYEEGIDFVAKVTKLLVIGLGTGSMGENGVSEGTSDVLRFLSFVTPYFNPSNIGTWTFTLGAFLHYFSYEICSRVGAAASMEAFATSNPELLRALCEVEPSLKGCAIPPTEVVLLLDKLLPLCQQSLYSKNPHVGRAGEASMLYFAQIDPARVTPSFIDFAIRALDISAVNLAHQAPAALSALTRLLQPALRSNPAMFMAKLPDILRLSLAGIDSNDQNKTIRTLILYRNLTSWFPIGKPSEQANGVNADVDKNDQKSNGNSHGKGTRSIGENLVDRLYQSSNSPEYVAAVEQLPESSLLRQGAVMDGLDLGLLADEASSAMCDWVLEFLDRIFALLRASGEREKAGKTSSRTAARHANVDVQQARNFSRVLRESLMQTFVAMDDTIHKSAVNSVVRFFSEETLPSAAKDAAYLCEAVASARPRKDGAGSSSLHSPGLKALLPILVDDLKHCPTKTCIYRIRCLAGAVRFCGHDILTYRQQISNAINFGLQSKDKHLHKTGCKLLRHTLAALCESRPISYDILPQLEFDPRRNRNNGDASGDQMQAQTMSDTLTYGRSAQLNGRPITWYIPRTESVDFAWALIDQNVYGKLKTLQGKLHVDADGQNDSIAADMNELRRTLRVVRYTLRGAVGIMLDSDNGDDIIGGLAKSTDHAEQSPAEMHDVALFPYERAMTKLLTQLVSEDQSKKIADVRGRIAFLITTLVSLIASETFQLKAQAAASPSPPSEAATSTDATDTTASDGQTSSDATAEAADSGESANGNGAAAEGSPANDLATLVSRDTKVCKEAIDIALLLLTRRGASFRSQESKTIWKAQKLVSTDYALLALADHAIESLQRSQLYGPSSIIQYNDGEDGGKVLPRRLVVNRVKLFHDSLQRTASFEVPRRLRRLVKLRKSSVNILFSVSTSADQLRDSMQRLDDMPMPGSMDLYEGLIDGLFSLCCHPNTQVRASSIGVVEYAITRFGWLVRSRVPRLMSAIRLDDGDWHGKFGVPSCAKLVDQVDSKGKRKRLSEALKGVCAILATARPGKQMLCNEEIRCNFVKTICGTDSLVALMPPEEMQKMVHYFHNIFSPFRMKFYSLPRTTKSEHRNHADSLEYLLGTLSSDKKSDDDETNVKEVHWRKQLMASYFLTVLVDGDDIRSNENEFKQRLWSTCFRILENEYGQPLQRVALGLFGRLVMISFDIQILRDQMLTESFCKSLSNALVYDHREDTSIGGGHDAQWSAGIADFIRDSARNIAPKTLFPFQRTSQSSGTFKASHAQLVEQILKLLSPADALTASRHLLKHSRQLASAPPSEDQRNQQCTVAEIFAGVCKGMLQIKTDTDLDEFWSTDLLPFLDDVYQKMPTSLSGAFFDAIRFSLQFSSPDRFYPMTAWLFTKVDETLWQPSQNDVDETGAVVPMDEATATKSGASEQGTEGFTAQSKWLYLCGALLVELDEMEADTVMMKTPWYWLALSKPEDIQVEMDTKDILKRSWMLVRDKLLPKLTAALGHPYENCRDHISGCLFRICHCHRKMARENASRSPSRTNSGNLDEMAQGAANMTLQPAVASPSSSDPGIFIVDKLLALRSSEEKSYKIRFNSLNTVRRFFSYCIHLGEAKHEYSDYLISLLPLAFDALETSTENSNDAADGNADIAKRSMESDIVKGYRYTIAEIGVAPVISYGSPGDISRVLDTVAQIIQHKSWQVRHAAAHFLRCFQGGHKFLFSSEQAEQVTTLVASMLADERREVASAAMAAITGILAALPLSNVTRLVKKYATQANKSRMKKARGKKAQQVAAAAAAAQPTNGTDASDEAAAAAAAAAAEREKKRAKTQQTSVYFLCAAVLAQPYDTPKYVPAALAAISKHSFERNAPLSVRETVKKCCAEYKRTHMSDNWELHRRVFTQEQLEALEDVVSSPHYYA